MSSTSPKEKVTKASNLALDDEIINSPPSATTSHSNDHCSSANQEISIDGDEVSSEENVEGDDEAEIVETSILKKKKEKNVFLGELKPQQIIPKNFDHGRDIKLKKQTTSDLDRNRNIPVQLSSSLVTQDKIDLIREECNWGPEVPIVIPTPENRTCNSVPGHSFICTYLFTIGFTLPINPIADTFCRTYNICLAQLGSVFWRIIQRLDYLSHEARVSFDFNCLVSLFYPTLHKDDVVQMNKRGQFSIITKGDDTEDRAKKLPIKLPKNLTAWIQAIIDAVERLE